MELYNNFVSCNTYPQWQPQKTDHLPIISVLEIEPERSAHTEKHNYRLTDWEEFRRTLVSNLADIQETEELSSVEECLKQIENLDAAIKGVIKAHVPVTRMSPYAKRWWNCQRTLCRYHPTLTYSIMTPL